ncbi:MAG: 50S ribosomal protein L24 [Candidatus Paceibacterota bacterium]
MKLKKGDSVMVISGKDKGKTGTIVRTHPSEGKVLIDGVGLYKRHLKAAGGGIVELPRAIDASNVMFMDPKEKKPTRIGRKVEDGKVVRFAKKSGTTLS